MPESKESGCTASLGLVRVHWKCFVVATAGMSNMIRTASDGTLLCYIDHIEHKWCMHGNCGMQAARRLPGSIPHSANEIAVCSSRLQRQAASVACNGHTFGHQASHS